MEASNYIRPVHSPPDPVCVCLCFTPALLFAYFLLISDWFENTFWPPVCAFLSSLFVYFVTIFSTLCEIFYFDLVCAFYLISVLSASVLIGLVFPLSPACHRVPFVSLPPTRLAWPCCCLLPLCLPACAARLWPFIFKKTFSPARHAWSPCSIGSQVLGLLLLGRHLETYSWHSV